MAYNRGFKGAPGPWSPPPDRTKDEPKPLPYDPIYPHKYWFIDIRYLVKLDSRWVYSICIIEGYLGKILAGMASPYQDELAIFQLLHAAFFFLHKRKGNIFLIVSSAFISGAEKTNLEFLPLILPIQILDFSRRVAVSAACFVMRGMQGPIAFGTG
jgi:hypothetical protein